ncbi:exodeoxyribonuclease VII large subunit [Limnohabitans sp. Jir61]|uniref:exodeoxyribonuclease VII large subunit n=1 Tax=Limnohabitans sp. Jir61 TaxID=1826168 RepID=UPI000D3D7D4F|nr:exodeoxyribonuclease VII large subunit [Limnohabitans sp. Jir61]PUE28620.1 exodeoxyribonuclease VII large subunit [Limnohabitans sp. Jir61]
MTSSESLGLTPRIWAVGALCRAVADVLDNRFNPVAVRGEISGFTRAASGHCYFTLKDASGQLRCAMFKRAAQMLDFRPVDGELVEIKGRLGVYEPRGELQMVVEHMRRAGQGAWFEQFLKLKAKLEAEGLFDAERKRPVKTMPRGIGVVTSLGAAALHDVATALQRRVPHIPVVLAPSLVQGPDAPPTLVQALQQLGQQPDIDVILLVRGGGSMEDLWAFNDENLARAIVSSPVPIICGVGHETDFTIADFCADLRAPTPTAAAEMCAVPQAELLSNLQLWGNALQSIAHRQLDTQEQRLDRAQARLGRPSEGLSTEKMQLLRLQQRLGQAVQTRTQRCHNELATLTSGLARGVQLTPATARERLHRAALRLELLDPKLVLQRGFAWLSDADGQAITSVAQTTEGLALQATLADGVVDLRVATSTQI